MEPGGGAVARMRGPDSGGHVQGRRGRRAHGSPCSGPPLPCWRQAATGGVRDHRRMMWPSGGHERRETCASARGHLPCTWAAERRPAVGRQCAHQRGGLWPLRGGEGGSRGVKDRPVAWGGGAVQCGDRLPTWRPFGGGRGARRRGAGGGTVGGSAPCQSVSVALGRAPAERRSAAPGRVSRGALLPGRPALDARPPANNPPAVAVWPPRGAQCQSASGRAGWRGPPAPPAAHRPLEWVSPPRCPAHSSRVAVGGGGDVGSRGRLRWGADGPVGSPVACPRRGPPCRGFAATVLAPADTRRHGLFGNNIGGVGGGGDGPRQERRRGRGRVACRQRRMRPRSPEFHCQA